MKILMHYRHFPVAMARYFHWTFEALGHQVYSVGPYSDGYIPWGDYYYPHHKFPPNFILPDGNVPLKDVLENLPFKPDIVFQAADTIFLDGPSPIPNVFFLTDPHAVDCTPRLKHADFVFCPQMSYMPKYARYLPYAYHPDIHNKDMRFKFEDAQYDVVFCGLQYDHRVKTLDLMKQHGLRVFNALGLIYEDYALAYNKGLIAFNWSSKLDLPARFWEGLAMERLVLTNRVPDLKYIDMKEDEHYVAFSTPEEAVEKAKFYSTHMDELKKIASAGYKAVKDHSYQTRCLEILSIIQK